jgi:hypothetical protein
MRLWHSWLVGLAGGAVGTAAVLGLLTVEDTGRRVDELTREMERVRSLQAFAEQRLASVESVYARELGALRLEVAAAQSALSALAGRRERIEPPPPSPLPPPPAQRSQQVLDTLDRLNRGATGQPVPR